MSKLGWGVIGLGRIVKTTMAPAMIEDPASDVVAAVSRDQGRADAFAEEFGARFAYTDYQQMLENPEVGAVFIATPNAQHADQVVAAAEAGKHVFCDKPLATNVPDAVRALKACANADVKLGINFHNRRLAWVQDTRDLIGRGDLGPVLTVQVEASAGDRPPIDWRMDPDLAGMGTTYNQGVHAFDFLRFILRSDPKEVAAFFDDDAESSGVETQCLVLIRFENGTLASLDINQRTPHPRNEITFNGTRGRIVGAGITRSRLDGELRVLTGGEETTTPYPQPSGAAHRDNLLAFTQSVLRDEEPNASGIDGVHSALLCEAIAESVSEKRVVTLDYSRLKGL